MTVANDAEPFRYEDGDVRTPLQIIDRFARSTGQSWGHFDTARAEARRYMAYLREGPVDAEERSLWEANGWNIDRKPSWLMIWQPRVKHHMRPRSWLWSVLSDLSERLDDAVRHRAERAERAGR